MPEAGHDLRVHALYLAFLGDNAWRKEEKKNALSDLRSIFLLNTLIDCSLALGRKLGTHLFAMLPGSCSRLSNQILS